MLPLLAVSVLLVAIARVERCAAGGPYHARAGQRVPTEANAICVLDLAPLVLKSLEICHVGRYLYAAAAVVFGRCFVEGNAAPTIRWHGLAVRRRAIAWCR